MRVHPSSLISRMIRAGLRNNACRYKVIAAGISHDGTIISIATNTPRLPNRGYHAEERVMFSVPPRLLSRILLIRINNRGDLLPIDPCIKCQRLADKRGVKVVKVVETL